MELKKFRGNLEKSPDWSFCFVIYHSRCHGPTTRVTDLLKFPVCPVYEYVNLVISQHCDDCLSLLDKRIRTDVLLIDFSQALDSVSHQRLLLKVPMTRNFTTTFYFISLKFRLCLMGFRYQKLSTNVRSEFFHSTNFGILAKKLRHFPQNQKGLHDVISCVRLQRELTTRLESLRKILRA